MCIRDRHTLKGTIGGVKIDCIAHRYKSLRPPHMESGLRLYDMEDIIAMKLAAISDDGSQMCIRDSLQSGYSCSRTFEIGNKNHSAGR